MARSRQTSKLRPKEVNPKRSYEEVVEMLRQSDRVYLMKPANCDPDQYVHVIDKSPEVLDALARVYLLNSCVDPATERGWYKKHMLLHKRCYEPAEDDENNPATRYKYMGAEDSADTFDSLAGNFIVASGPVYYKDVYQAAADDSDYSDDSDDSDNDADESQTDQGSVSLKRPRSEDCSGDTAENNPKRHYGGGIV